MTRVLRRTAAAAVALLAGGSAAVVPAATAFGVTKVESAYWWQGAPAAPPQVPAGGLYVASAATGPQAVSAVRVPLAEGEAPSLLTLKVAQVDANDAQGASQVADASVVACPAKGTWKDPGGPGAMSDAPTADCAKGSVAGMLSADQKTMTFDLTVFSAQGTLDLVLAPADVAAPTQGSGVPGAPTTVYPSFDIAFDKVTPEAVQTSGGTAPDSSGGAPAPAGGDSTYAPTGSSGGAPAYQPPPTSSGAFNPPAPSGPGLDQSPVVAAQGDTTAAPAPQLPAQATAPVAVQAPERWDRDRMILLLLIVNIGIYVWWDGKHRTESGARPRRHLFDPPPEPSYGSDLSARRVVMATPQSDKS